MQAIEAKQRLASYMLAPSPNVRAYGALLLAEGDKGTPLQKAALRGLAEGSLTEAEECIARVLEMAHAGEEISDKLIHAYLQAIIAKNTAQDVLAALSYRAGDN